MVSDHQSGWSYLFILGALVGLGLIIWALGKLFPAKTHAATGNALMRAEVFFNPSREHVIEAKEYEEKEDDGGGNPPVGGDERLSP
jgi:hypothetical protein